MRAFHRIKIISSQAGPTLTGKAGIVFLSSIVLSACTSSPADMQKGGLFSTLRNLHNGSYDKQIEEKRSRLATLQEQQHKQQQQTAAVQSRSAQAQKQIGQLQADLQTAQNRIQNLNTENASLQTQLQTTSQQKQGEKRAIAQLEKQETHTPTQPLENMAALIAKREQLRKELSLLLR